MNKSLNIIHSISATYHLVLSTCIILCFCACGKDDGNGSKIPSNEEAPIAFCTTISEDQTTRAEDKGLKDYGYAEFGVFGMKYNGDATSDVQTIMRNYRVQYDASRYNYQSTLEHWGYEGLLNVSTESQYLKYWDDEIPFYQFVAYAPYAEKDREVGNLQDETQEELADGKKVVKNVNKGTDQNHTMVLGFYNFLKGNLPYSTYNDFILAHYQRDATSNLNSATNKDILENTTLSSTPFHGNVPLAFNRLTCVVEFRIYQQAPNNWNDPGISTSNFAYKDIDIKINNFYDKGTVYENIHKTVTTEGINWGIFNAAYRTNIVWGTKINSNPATTNFGSNLKTSADIPIDNGTYKYTATITPTGGIIQLPQGGVDIVATVTVPISGNPDATKTVNITNQTWQANKRYVYYLIYPWAEAEDIKVVLKELAWNSGGSQEFEETDW